MKPSEALTIKKHEAQLRVYEGNAIAEPIEVHGIAKNKDEIREKVKLLLRVAYRVITSITLIISGQRQTR